MSDFKPVSQTVTPMSADPGEEFPFLHTITVVDRVVSVDKPELVQNNIKTETVTLNLDSEWDGLSCIINIGSGETPTSLIWSGQPVTIPAELMTDTGTLNVSVVGYGDDGALRAVTKKADAMFTVVASGYVEGDEPVPDPTTILGQLTEAADKANQAADRFNQASEDIGDISDAVTEVKGYANAAKASEATAASSAATASLSESNAASSASAAKISETNAADSATAAREAVDGFGLEVGTTTTGEPGTDAAVAIQKNGTKYTANFTIPRGDVGPAGVNENVPLGTASGIVAQATDAYPALPRKVQVHGRTIENLWPEMNVSKNGITVSVESGVINVTGTASARFSTNSTIGSLSPGDKITIAVNKTDSNVAFDLYAYKSGSYVSTIAGVKGTASVSGEIPADGFDEIRAYIIVEQGNTVDWSGMVMLVEGDTVPDVFVPSGVHTVEPTKIIEAGHNVFNLSSLPSDIYKVEDGTVTILQPDNRDWAKIPYSAIVPPGNWIFHKNGGVNVQVAFRRMGKPNDQNVVSLYSDYILKTDEYTEILLKAFIAGGNNKFRIQVNSGESVLPYSNPEYKEVDFPSDISLADGDTLTIDRDGTTQIVHAEGEPTVLENVTLPELPAPTFNVYTVGGYVPPTVDVDYEQDVNLVLQALEAKIASLEVNQTIMQGA